MKKITIHRNSTIKGAKNYTPLANEILQSGDMTSNQIAILVYLISLPETFNVLQKNVSKHFKGRIGREKFYKEWNILEDKGYILKVYTKEGNLQKSHWEIYELPVIKNTGNRDSQHPVNIESNNKENNNIESKDKEKNNTGSSILGEDAGIQQTIFSKNSILLEDFNSSNEIMDSKYYQQQIESSLDFIIKATSLGEDIGDYLAQDTYDSLIALIGKEKAEEIIYHVKIINDADEKLKKIFHDSKF